MLIAQKFVETNNKWPNPFKMDKNFKPIFKVNVAFNSTELGYEIIVSGCTYDFVLTKIIESKRDAQDTYELLDGFITIADLEDLGFKQL